MVPFLLDDSYLPYMLPNFYVLPIGDWIRGLRPLLMFSYWLNFKESGNEVTFGYHMVNVALHFLNGVLIYFAIRKVLSWIQRGTHPGRRFLRHSPLDCFCSIRSKPNRSAMSPAARKRSAWSSYLRLMWSFFIARALPSGVGTTIAILILFGAALLSKEHSAVLPVLLLLTDYYWNPGFTLRGHPPQLEAICSYRDRRSRSASCSCSGS